MSVARNTFVWCGLIALFPFMASAATIRIPVDQPTIQAGIDAANDMDTVLVAPGTYVENISFNGKRVVVTSEAGANLTTIQAADPALAVVSFTDNEPKGAELSGLTITGSNNSGIVCTESSPTILNNIITGNRSSYNNGGAGIDMNSTSGALVRGNEFFGNTAHTYGAGIHTDWCAGDTICYNLFHHNRGIVEIRCLNTEAVIYNNTISATDWSGVSLDWGHLQIRNNIIFFATNYAVQIVTGTCVAEYNCTYANKNNYLNVAPGPGSIYDYAIFADSASGDYNLQSGSPCINAGDPDPFFNDPDGSRNDMGALMGCSDPVDSDGDGIGDSCDNCPLVSNPGQEDFDGDGLGDACDDDDDGDGIVDTADNCPYAYNPDQADNDGDGAGDICDICAGYDDGADQDADGVPDGCDNCPAAANTDQADADGDGVGDLCDDDSDNDGVSDDADNCPMVANPAQEDDDGDGVGDVCDLCPDYDDGMDQDNDTVPNGCDNCPMVANTDQTDADEDGIGDACDDDVDGDDVPNHTDNCPTTFNPTQEDADGDGIGDACEFVGWGVVLESKNVTPGQEDITIKVRLYSLENVANFVLPLVVRELAVPPAGAFWAGDLPVDTQHGTARGVDWNWENPAWPSIVQELRPRTVQPGAYDGVSPDHFVISAFGPGSEPAHPGGRDCITLHFDVGAEMGVFEFDTAFFSTPLNRIFVIDDQTPAMDHGLEIEFTRGIVFIGSCNGANHCDLNTDGSINPVDVVTSVNYVYKAFDGRAQHFNCPYANGDWNCDGKVNPVDVVYMVNYTYKGNSVAPCNPCAPE